MMMNAKVAKCAQIVWTDVFNKNNSEDLSSTHIKFQLAIASTSFYLCLKTKADYAHIDGLAKWNLFLVNFLNKKYNCFFCFRSNNSFNSLFAKACVRVCLYTHARAYTHISIYGKHFSLERFGHCLFQFINISISILFSIYKYDIRKSLVLWLSV